MKKFLLLESVCSTHTQMSNKLLNMKHFYSLLVAAFFGMAAHAQVNVTFSVDMSDVAEVSAEGVYLAGEFQGWNPSGTLLTDAGNGIWAITLSLPVGDHEFKFLNGPSFSFEEIVPDACRANLTGNTNRKLTVNEGDTDVTYAVCFSNCAACGEYAVLFRVDMSLEAEVAPQGVHVAGSFQGPVWDPGAVQLNDNGTGVYSRLVTFDPAILNGEALQFKYINGNDWLFPNENVSNDCGQGGNRVLELTSANTVTPNFCFNACGTCVAPVEVEFSVDMSNETVNADGVHIAGTLQSVGQWNPGIDELTDPDGDGIYSITLTLQPGSYEFKFVNGAGWPSGDNDYQDESVPSACASNNNRVVTVTEEAGQAFQFCFGQCSEVCSANPDPADITFSVNTANITVSADGIWLMGNFTAPAWQAGAIQMNDDDADGIYTATATVSGTAEFQYKFANGDPFPGGVVDASVEETFDFASAGCGVPNGIGGFNRIHVRSGQAETLPLTDYNACPAVNVTDYSSELSVGVYPNPATDQLFLDVDFTGFSEVRVFDLSGRVVFATSINFTAGTAERLDVTALTNGMYFVQVEAGAKRSTIAFVKQ